MNGCVPDTRREARHLALQQIGADGQARVAGGRVLLIGVGGVGCAAAQYLVSAGVGCIVLCDFDSVDQTNLGRQVLFGNADVGESKVDVAARRLAQQNPDIDIQALDRRLDDDELLEQVRKADVVLDGSDNFATRFQVGAACVAAQRILVSGAAIRLEGQVVVFGPDYENGPCYRCLYAEADESLDSCAGNGVLAPVPGVIGAIAAVETLKSLAGLSVTGGVLSLYDAAASTFSPVRVAKREDCPVCQP